MERAPVLGRGLVRDDRHGASSVGERDLGVERAPGPSPRGRSREGPLQELPVRAAHVDGDGRLEHVRRPAQTNRASHRVAGKRRLDEDLRRLLLDRAPSDRRVDNDAFTTDCLDRLPIDAERDPLDRREPGQRRDDLSDATEHRRAATTIVERPVDVYGRHPVRERNVAQGRPARDRGREPVRALAGRRPFQQLGERRARDGGCRFDRPPHRADLPVPEEVDGDRRHHRACLRGGGRRRPGRGLCCRAAVAPCRKQRTEHRDGCGRADRQTGHRAHGAGEMFGNHSAASRASAASVRPTIGANLNPCPEHADPTTIRPWRSRTNSSSAVFV